MQSGCVILAAILGVGLALSGCSRGDDGPAPVIFGNESTRSPAVWREPGDLNGPGIHTVKRGQTLSGIATQYNVDMDSIATLNNLSPPYTLRIGQRLRIPRPRLYEVIRGDTVYGIARRFHVPIRAVIEANDLSPPYHLRVDQVLRIPQPRQHEVVKGDTLYSISRQYSVNTRDLARLNDLAPPYTITPGQDLLIPASRGRVARANSDSSQTLDPASGQPQNDEAVSSNTATEKETASKDEAAKTSPTKTFPEQVVATSIPKPRVKPAAIKQIATRSADSDKKSTKNKSSERPSATQTASSRPTEVPDPPARESNRFAWPLRGEILTDYGPQTGGLHNDGINIEAERGDPVRASANGVVAYVGNELRGFGNLILIKHTDNWITAYAHLDKISVERGQRVTRGEVIAQAGQTGGVARPQLHFETRRGSDAVNPEKMLGRATAHRGMGRRGIPQMARADSVIEGERLSDRPDPE